MHLEQQQVNLELIYRIKSSETVDYGPQEIREELWLASWNEEKREFWYPRGRTEQSVSISLDPRFLIS